MVELTQKHIADRDTCVAKKEKLIANVRMLRETLEEKQGSVGDAGNEMVRASETYEWLWAYFCRDIFSWYINLAVSYL